LGGNGGDGEIPHTGEGRLPQRALALARAWGKLHVEELERDWELARGHRPLRRIAPLE